MNEVKNMTFQELMDVSVNNPVVYGELLRQLSKRVTPVIGAGLSAWAKYPLWGKLIENLADGSCRSSFQRRV